MKRRLGILGLGASALVLGRLVGKSLRRRRRFRTGRTVKAVTIDASPDDVAGRWGERSLDGSARLDRAPGGRGTIVRVEVEGSGRRVYEELRRLKQIIETGEVVRA